MKFRFKVKRCDNWIEVYLPMTKGYDYTYIMGFTEDNTLWLTDIYVAKDLRGKGVGKQLVNRIVQESRCKNFKVFGVVDTAHGFWSNMGVTEEKDGRTKRRLQRTRSTYLQEEGYI